MEKEAVGKNRYLTVAKYYHKLGDYEKALENYSKAVEKEPGNKEIYFQRALTYIARKEYEKAKADIRKAIEVGGDFAEAHHAMGNIYDQQQDFAKAREEYNKAIKLSPGQEHVEEAPQESLSEQTQPKKFSFLEKPNMDFSDVAGLGAIKELINESIVYPLKNPQLAQKYGKKAGGGVIFYGPPGCGKTYIGKATAGESNAAFLNIKISDIMDMYVGNTEKNIRNIFDTARKNKPSIIFFDEIDGVGGRRDSSQQGFEKRAINQFLIEMDGVEYSNEGVLIIGSTNAPWNLDTALRRSGRFSKFIYFPEPDKKTREEVFRIHLRDKPLGKGVSYSRLARMTEGYSIADIKAVCDEALAIPWKQALKTGHERAITTKDFVAATKRVQPSLPAWYTAVKRFLIKDTGDAKGGDPGMRDGRIVVEHKRAQEELINEEERKQFSELVREVSMQGNFSHKMLRKIKIGFARYVF